MTEIIKGITKKHASSELLVKFFESNKANFEGTLYIGYPILYGGDDNITVDALWMSEKYGIVIFDLIENNSEIINFEERQDKIFSLIDSQLRAYPKLKRNRRELAVNIEIISFANGLTNNTESKALFAENEKSLKSIIDDDLSEWKESQELFKEVTAVVQSVINLKVKETRANVTKKDSKGYKIKDIENTLATLDRNQESVVIEFFDGVQRIRGLAGSGKTIVLALKAAYLHTQNPDWHIAVTFNTRSLKQQFKNLIERFCIEKKREAPNWKKIKVVNAWGSSKDDNDEKGIYYDFCITHGIEYFDFRKAKNLIGTQNNITPFGIIAEKAIKEAKSVIEKYDAILIDEAQDLSEPFLNLCYKFLKPPKRLIYAYDELQKLNEGSSLRNPKEFILKKNQFKDTILKVCYRNSKPLLVTAHALGFGIYRKNDSNKTELVQFFDQPQLWKEVGYKVSNGKELKIDETVELIRTEESSPEYLEKHSDIDDLIVFKKFENETQQAEWIVNEIEKNIKEDELLHTDIIVINPIALTTKKEVAIIRSMLLEKEIDNHIAGEFIAGEFNANIFHRPESIVFTGINRAKGNEAAMVYIINAQDCYSGTLNSNFDLIRRRNILFTAITRSKAWVRVIGIGNDMNKLISEYHSVKEKDFSLKFNYPSKEQISRMNLIHRDITDEEKNKLNQDNDTLNDITKIIEKIKKEDAHIEDYPDDKQKILRKLLR